MSLFGELASLNIIFLLRYINFYSGLYNYAIRVESSFLSIVLSPASVIGDVFF